MKEYFSTLIAVALLTSVFGMLSPVGKIKKYVRLAGAFCLLCALLFPWIDLFLKNEEISEIFLSEEWQSDTVDYHEIYQASLMDGGTKNAQFIMKNRILNHFSLPEDGLDLQIKVDVGKDTMILTEVTVWLHSSAIWLDPQELMSYVNREWGCPCVVIYD